VVPYLIGKRGVSIQEFMTESGARIFFEQKAGPAKDGVTKVDLRGSEEAISKAKALIAQAIETYELNETPKPKLIQVGHIIGKGGATIKRLKEESGAQIWVDQLDETGQLEATERPMYILGSQESVDKAKELVKSLLESERQESRAGDKSLHSQESFSIKNAMVSLVIGKKGSKIQQISSDSGALVFIDALRPGEEQDDGELMREVTVRGTPDAIARARDMIDEVIRNSQNNSFGSRENTRGQRSDRPNRRRRMFDRGDDKVHHDGIMEGSFMMSSSETISATVDEEALVDVDQIVQELKEAEVEVDKELEDRLKVLAEILSFNPTFTLGQKRLFLKEHAVNANKEIPEELQKVFDY